MSGRSGVPGDLVTAWTLYLLARGQRARNFLKIVEELKALLRSGDPIRLPPAKNPLEAARRQAAELRSTKRQIETLSLLIVRLDAELRALAQLEAELASLSATDNPILAEPQVRGALTTVIAELPAALAMVRETLGKMRTRRAALVERYRQILRALAPFGLARF